MYRTKDGRRITVQMMTMKELDSVLKLWQALADEKKYIATEKVTEKVAKRWRKSIGDRRTLRTVAKVNGELVGTLALTALGDLKKMEHVRNLGMGVAKRYRGCGIGTALMDYALKWAAKNRVEKVDLSAFCTNEAALGLYKKFGFEREGVRRRQFRIDGKYVDEVMMGRFIRQNLSDMR